MKYIKTFENYFSGLNTEEEINKRYKELAKKYHPDVPNGDVKIMQQINVERNKLINKNTKHNIKSKWEPTDAEDVIFDLKKNNEKSFWESNLFPMDRDDFYNTVDYLFRTTGFRNIAYDKYKIEYFTTDVMGINIEFGKYYAQNKSEVENDIINLEIRFVYQNHSHSWLIYDKIYKKDKELEYMTNNINVGIELVGK